MWQFGENYCWHRLRKVAQSAINRPIWSHWFWPLTIPIIRLPIVNQLEVDNVIFWLLISWQNGHLISTIFSEKILIPLAGKFRQFFIFNLGELPESILPKMSPKGGLTRAHDENFRAYYPKHLINRNQPWRHNCSLEVILSSAGLHQTRKFDRK